MKLIITEEQLRLIVESEKEDKGENLMDLTSAYEGGLSPNKWDSFFLFMNNKKKTDYDGYYIDGNVNLSKSDITEFKYLVKVGGYLNLSNSKIESLPMLSKVEGYLYLKNTQITELPMLSEVGDDLYLGDTPITELPLLTTVGGDLNLNDTLLGKELNKTMSKEEIKNKFGVKFNLSI